MTTLDELVGGIRRMTPTATDDAAARAVFLYPQWAVGIEITQDMIDSGQNRYQYNGLLYRTETPHTTQENWKPGVETAAIWTAINAEHAGTIEDPIPVPEELVSFEYEWGKYYDEAGTLYICDRQRGKVGDKYTLAYKPSQLIGQYFSAVEEQNG